jgi:hypothetical protein
MKPKSIRLRSSRPAFIDLKLRLSAERLGSHHNAWIRCPSIAILSYFSASHFPRHQVCVPGNGMSTIFNYPFCLLSNGWANGR